MVYGFAKQSEGHLSIASEEGRGTTVKLYLPVAEEPPAHEEPASDGPMPQGRGETILVVEDDEDVRVLAVKLLGELGYRVIAVADAAAAHQALAREAVIHLILSDVMLPGGESGPAFARELRAEFPDFKIIFMSGYPAEAAKRNGVLGAERVLLNKPFQPGQLARALRQALD